MHEPITLGRVVAELQNLLAVADEVLTTADEWERKLRDVVRQPHRLDHAQLGRIQRHYGAMLDGMSTFELLLRHACDSHRSTREKRSVAQLEEKMRQVRHRLTNLGALVAEVRSHPTADRKRSTQ